MSRLYPVVIAKSRYGGAYSGGTWIGFIAYSIPEAAVSDDITCNAFWMRNKDNPAVAVGSTPDEVVWKLDVQNMHTQNPDVFVDVPHPDGCTCYGCMENLEGT